MDQSLPTYPKARKDHRCFGCGETIPKGSRYALNAVFDNGEAYSIKLCAKCVYAKTRLDSGDDGYGEGELKEDHQYLPDDYSFMLARLAEEYDARMKRIREERKESECLS